MRNRWKAWGRSVDYRFIRPKNSWILPKRAKTRIHHQAFDPKQLRN